MDNKYNHIGRPTNEEVKKRKQKKQIKALLILLAIFLVGSGIFVAFNFEELSLSSIMGNSATQSNIFSKKNRKIYVNNNANYLYYLQSSLGINDTIYYTTSISGDNIKDDYKSKGYSFDSKNKSNVTGVENEKINNVFNYYKNYKNNDMTYNPNNKKIYYINYDLAKKNDSVILDENGLVTKTTGYKFYNIEYSNVFKKYISVTNDKVYFYTIDNNNKEKITINKVCNLDGTLNDTKTVVNKIQGIATYDKGLYVAYRTITYNNGGKVSKTDNYVNLYDLRNCLLKTNKATLKQKYDLGSNEENYYVESIFFMNNKLYLGFSNKGFNKIVFNEIDTNNTTNIISKLVKKDGNLYIQSNINNNNNGIMYYSVCKSKNIKECNFKNANAGGEYNIKYGNFKFKRRINEAGTYYVHIKDNFGNFVTSNQVVVTTKDFKNAIPLSDVSFSEENININYGETKKISVDYFPKNATNKELIWTSSNSKLLSVDKEGNIKVLKNENGQSVITIKSDDGGFSDNINVNITKGVLISGISFDKNNLTLKYNEKAKINATVTPANATNKEIIWTSSDNSLVTVDSNGNLVAKSGKYGMVTIKAKAKVGGHEKSITVKVLPNNDFINFEKGRSYTAYKLNMKLDRTNAVMQSFAISNGHIYISQQQATNPGATFAKIKLNDIKNDANNEQWFRNTSALIENTGHAENIDIEVTNNKEYLWVGCSKESTTEVKYTQYHCRIPMESIKFGKLLDSSNKVIVQKQKNLNLLKIAGDTKIAVDSKNRIFTIMSGSKKNQVFTSYNLDDYINNKGNAKIISQFTNKVSEGISRQGFDIDGNYIYSFEGHVSYAPDKVKPVVYLSIFTLDGQRVLFRTPISYPDNKFGWEPEGVKIYNGRIYVGFAKIITAKNSNEKNRKTANIFVMNKK